MKNKKNILMAQLQEELWGKDSFKAKVRMGDIDENQFKRIIDILFQIRKELSPEELTMWNLTSEMTDLVDHLSAFPIETERGEKAEELILEITNVFS